MMRKFILSLSAMMIVGISAQAEGYQHGWKVYEKPQAGATYGGYEANPYGAGGSKSYGAGGGKSYGAGGGNLTVLVVEILTALVVEILTEQVVERIL